MPPGSAQVRATDCLLRGGGDILDVAAGRRLDVELSNCVLGAGGSLVHGHGLPRGATTEPLKVTLRQVTARLAGGLVQLESAPGEPDLPTCEVVARDTILATNSKDGPLVRIDGQDGLEALREQVKWEGHGVVYHQIETYRRDQTAQPGMLPVRFDRPSWLVAVAPGEDAPIHGDARFLTPWEPNRSPASMTRDDAKLDLDAPAPAAGPDLSRIPPPPARK